MEFLDIVEVENKVNIIFGAIYLIKNNINGMCYVGQQKTKNKTFYAVTSSDCNLLYNTFKNMNFLN